MSFVRQNSSSIRIRRNHNVKYWAYKEPKQLAQFAKCLMILRRSFGTVYRRIAARCGECAYEMVCNARERPQLVHARNPRAIAITFAVLSTRLSERPVAAIASFKSFLPRRKLPRKKPVSPIVRSAKLCWLLASYLPVDRLSSCRE